MIHTESRLNEALTLIAVGLLQQQLHRQPVTLLHPQIRRGWEILSSLCFEGGIMPPRTVPELVHWLHNPVGEWGLEHGQHIGQSLMENGEPAGLAYKLGEPFANTYNPRMEMQDAQFRQFFNHCKQNNDQQLYPRGREFLNRNSILSDAYEKITANEDWSDEVSRMLMRCYEVMPQNCIRHRDGEAVVYLCPHCGWALSWRKDRAFCHADGPCKMIYGDLGEYDLYISYEGGAMARTTEGVQRYVVAPEVTLIQLHDTLQGIWGVRCELYPELDAYDLLLSLPNGEKWAVDVKDWKSPEAVALNIGEFRYVPPWNRAFYVFPDYRMDGGTYLTRFNNYWSRQKDVTPISKSDFVRRVKFEVGV
jgi:hypothetical protein